MKKRVCAYARVSTNSRSQEHSFEFQSNYWNEKLSTSSEYEYVGLYADKGISGKFSERRPQFMLMVSAIKGGQIDLVFCKSVQRFARNTEELLMYVREFRELGVGVFFEKENINTLTNGDDLYLTIAAAIAEDDLSRYSQNMTWTFRDKFRKGECPINGRMYGFEMGKGKEIFKIIENEAVVIRRIYQMYLDGDSADTIAMKLDSEGIPSPTNGKWSKTTIQSFLKNEKYVGDCLLQKEYTENGVKHRNKGERDMYYVENHHNPIVSREIWDKVQEQLEVRGCPKLRGKINEIYPFTKMITCGCCGGTYHHKVSHSHYTPDFNVWYCRSHSSKCTSIRVKDEELKQMFIDAYNEFITKKYKGEEEQDLQNKINDLENEKNEIIRLYANGWIGLTSYKEEIAEITKKESELIRRLEGIKLRDLSEKDFKPIDVFDSTKVDKFLSSILIRGKVVEFKFYNGVVVKKLITMTRIYDKDDKKLREIYGGTYDEI